MNTPDENGELHPSVPPELPCRYVYLVVVQNNETDEIERLKAFDREVDAQDYANSFDQHWLRVQIRLLPIH